jgi:hypothetical protein
MCCSNGRGDASLSRAVVQFLLAAFSLALEFDASSAEEHSLAAIRTILKRSPDERMQRDLVYALYNLSEHDHCVSRRLAEPEWTRRLLRLYETRNFYVTRAVVQLFLSIDARCRTPRPALTIAAMDTIVAIIDGYRGGMLAVVLDCLFHIFRTASDAGDDERVLEQFVRGGGVDALFVVMDDELARDEARQKATDLFDEYFNSARESAELLD